MKPPTQLTVVENVSHEELFTVISGATSQDPKLVVASSSRLKDMLDMFGTFDALNLIATQKNLDLRVRQQSIIQFKNHAMSHWKSRKLMSDEQRVNIRARCLTLLDETDDIIAECNGLIVAKIARHDYPSKWPSLLPDLIMSINTHIQERFSDSRSNPRSTLTARRSLELLNEIIKEISSIRMPSGMKTMGQMVEQLNLVLQGHYSSLAAGFDTSLTPAGIKLEQTADNVRLAHIIYKCLSKCTTWLWNKLGQTGFEAFQTWFLEFFQNSVFQLQTLYELRIKLIESVGTTQLDVVSARSLDYLTRHVRLFGKFFRRVQQLSAPRFVKLPMSSELVLFYWNKVVQATNGSPNLISESPLALFPVRFIVQAMVLFKESLAQYAPIQRSGKQNDAVLSIEFVAGAVSLLVTRFIPLNLKDLDGWMADPEEWVNLEDKENEQWEYELRPCGERVLMTLAFQYKDYVAPLLLTTFQQVVGQPTLDLESIVQKEALYCAIGRCAMLLRDVIPFEQWLEQNLVSESQDTNPNYPIIKRRIAWVIGRWVHEECATPKNPTVWQVLVHLLGDRSAGTDAVVRLTAAVALRECVDTLGFDADVLEPHLPTIVTELVRLAAEADTLEAKRRVTRTLNIVIERVGIRIVPHIGMITAPLPELWNAAGTDYPFKVSLLETVTKVIESCKEHSASLGGLIVPLVQECFSDEARLHLDDDGLILWLAALRNTITIESVNGAPGLYELVPIATDLLATNLDLLGKILSIIESYFILGADKVLLGHGVILFQAFVTAMGQANSMNVKDMAMALNLLVQVAPAQLWAEPMHLSGLFSTVLKAMSDDKAAVGLLTEYVYLAARMALSDSLIFTQLMSVTATVQSVSEHTLWEVVLDQLWRRFDNMSEPRYRKLVAMGIANLVATGRREVLDRLTSEIFNIWLDVFGEIKEALADVALSDGASSPTTRIAPSPLILYWHDAEAAAMTSSFLLVAEGTLEYDRRKNLFVRDIVSTAKLTNFVADRLQEAQNACGGAEAFEARCLQKADQTVLKQLQKELASI